MGYAIADECASRGADVTIISGPVNVKPVARDIRIINVTSAAEMYTESAKHFKESDIAVLSAAVADFTPKTTADHKIKRGRDNMSIELCPTVDIAEQLGKQKADNQILVGFALETDDEETHALDKLKRKNLDFIVLNSLKNAGTCFGYDTNKIKIFDKSGGVAEYPLKSKREVAKDIVDKIEICVK